MSTLSAKFASPSNSCALSNIVFDASTSEMCFKLPFSNRTLSYAPEPLPKSIEQGQVTVNFCSRESRPSLVGNEKNENLDVRHKNFRTITFNFLGRQNYLKFRYSALLFGPDTAWRIQTELSRKRIRFSRLSEPKYDLFFTIHVHFYVIEVYGSLILDRKTRT